MRHQRVEHVAGLEIAFARAVALPKPYLLDLVPYVSLNPMEILTPRWSLTTRTRIRSRGHSVIGVYGERGSGTFQL
jgi:hypothetical protein